ncbi:MAG: phosphatidate cytidylyltransferase [Microbacteriaceae bacterium]|jgi:phosphatidate cytidylyltransferase|nr:phosphatidate cytidylyltransferase [Microbacteriaceae bacterium]
MPNPPEGTGVPEGQGHGLKRLRAQLKREEFEARAHATRDDIRAQIAATRAQLDQANEKIEARAGRNLPLAILFGLVLGVSMLLSLIVVKALFMIVAAVLIGFTALELASALRFAGRDVPRVPTILAALAVVPAAFYLGDGGRWLVFLGGVLFVALWRTAELARADHRGSAEDFWKDVGAGTFIQAYVPFLGSFAVLLTAREGGEWWTLAFLLIVVSVDIGAYASGLLLGKHPMAPRISPKKTWEGFGGSVVVAVVGGVILGVLMLGQPWWVGLIFGLTMVATGTIGDLTESLIKRDLGVKDISTWLPGHGGFLDRMDSILPSAAAAYALFLLIA